MKAYETIARQHRRGRQARTAGLGQTLRLAQGVRVSQIGSDPNCQASVAEWGCAGFAHTLSGSI
jgi:hypothetical protein